MLCVTRLGSIHGGPRPIPSALGCAGAAAARRARLRRARRSPALLRDCRWSDWQPMPSCTACWPLMLRHAACRDGKVHKLLTSCTVDACSMVQSSVEKLLQMFVFDILVDLHLRCLLCCLHIADLTPCCLHALLLSVDVRVDTNLKYVARVLDSTVPTSRAAQIGDACSTSTAAMNTTLVMWLLQWYCNGGNASTCFDLMPVDLHAGGNIGASRSVTTQCSCKMGLRGRTITW